MPYEDGGLLAHDETRAAYAGERPIKPTLSRLLHRTYVLAIYVSRAGRQRGRLSRYILPRRAMDIES